MSVFGCSVADSGSWTADTFLSLQSSSGVWAATSSLVFQGGTSILSISTNQVLLDAGSIFIHGYSVSGVTIESTLGQVTVAGASNVTVVSASNVVLAGVGLNGTMFTTIHFGKGGTTSTIDLGEQRIRSPSRRSLIALTLYILFFFLGCWKFPQPEIRDRGRRKLLSRFKVGPPLWYCVEKELMCRAVL